MIRPFDILGRRWYFITASLLVTLAGFVLFAAMGFNLGTDFTSGSQIQFAVHERVRTPQIEAFLAGVGDPVPISSITVAGTNGQTAIVRFPRILTAAQEGHLSNAVDLTFLHPALRIDTVNPLAAQQMSRQAVSTVLAAAALIALYIIVRYEYRFAVAGIVALFHDAFIVMSVFVLLRLQVNLTFIAAILTILGYSINDTIIIFDRIHENMKEKAPQTRHAFYELVQKSIWQSMSRSLKTVTTVLIAAFVLFIFGGESVQNFSFALVVGLLSGAYSSIFIAAPIWFIWYGRRYSRM